MTTGRAVVVGAGPNGLVAARDLARAGWEVEVVEAADRPGGGVRSRELTRPGFVHDVCSAVHPLAVVSPALRDTAVRWSQPDVPLAHPLDGGRCVVVERDVGATAAGLGRDAVSYRRLVEPFVEHADALAAALLSRIPVPSPLVARFGIRGIVPAAGLARTVFSGEAARALLAGLAGHATLPLEAPLSAAFGMFLGVLAHAVGWPVPEGGAQSLADALTAEVTSAGGTVTTGRRVTSLGELGPARAVVLDLTPREVVAVTGAALPARYRRVLERFRHGPGVCKVDWALDGPVPWIAEGARRAVTVHVGGTLGEIASAERAVHRGVHAERPFVLLVQPSVVDPTRAPPGHQTLWAYCHVPAGSDVDVSAAVEDQVERFAPGFRARIVGRHVTTAARAEAARPDRVGGDINGGAMGLRRLLVAPAARLHPWRTPVEGLYLCSSSTPPGPGVHGMCGHLAARTVLSDAHRDRCRTGRSRTARRA